MLGVGEFLLKENTFVLIHQRRRCRQRICFRDFSILLWKAFGVFYNTQEGKLFYRRSFRLHSTMKFRIERLLNLFPFPHLLVSEEILAPNKVSKY
jgi:hypothetical protein